MTEQETALIPANSSMFFHVAKFELAQRVARVFAESTMVPEVFQKNLGNCLIVLNLADRMRVDPFMLFQNVYVIHGKPAIEAKLGIAAFNSSGKWTPISYLMENPNTENWSCIAYAKRKDSKETLKGAKVSLEMARKEGWMNKQGSKWKSMPELMLQYRAAMFFVRAFAPEVLLGMYSREELYDAEMDLVKRANGTYGPEELAEKLDTTGEPGAAEALYGEKPEGDSPKSPATDNQEAILATLFEDVTKIPLATFEKLRSKGVEQFAKNYWGLYLTWPEKIQDIIRAKFDNPNHPEWAKLLQPETKALPKDDEGEDWNGLKRCPKMGGNNTPKTNCKGCLDRPGCPEWGGGVKAD